jgi:hypothetical protein
MKLGMHEYINPAQIISMAYITNVLISDINTMASQYYLNASTNHHETWYVRISYYLRP